MRSPLSRRDFLKFSAVGLGSLALFPHSKLRQNRAMFSDFPEGDRLGRALATLPIKAAPDAASETLGTLFEDQIFEIGRRVVGSNLNRFNQTYIEMAEGYVWSPDVQPVKNEPNLPISTLPQTNLGEGMWAEVSIPYVDLEIANPPTRAPWLANRIANGLPPRFFHSQIAWVDQVQRDAEDRVLYRINEQFGYGDIFWAPAEAFRPLTPEEIAPINPEIEEKRIVVNITRQTMSCFEGETEVYFARVSTGALFNFRGERVDSWGTPLGRHRIWRKAVSLPLSGGSAEAGWALPAVGWISLFVGSGVAFHSTYWHNNYGTPTSRGCVNCSPDDSKFVFRWTQPHVAYDPGDVTVGMPGGTTVEVIDS